MEPDQPHTLLAPDPQSEEDRAAIRKDLEALVGQVLLSGNGPEETLFSTPEDAEAFLREAEILAMARADQEARDNAANYPLSNTRQIQVARKDLPPLLENLMVVTEHTPIDIVRDHWARHNPGLTPPEEDGAAYDAMGALVLAVAFGFRTLDTVPTFHPLRTAMLLRRDFLRHRDAKTKSDRLERKAAIDRRHARKAQRKARKRSR